MKYLKSISTELALYRQNLNNDCGKGNKGNQKLAAVILGKTSYRVLRDWG